MHQAATVLYSDAVKGLAFAEDVRKEINVDTDLFKDALDFHKTMAFRSFVQLALFLLAALIVIVLAFDLLNLYKPLSSDKIEATIVSVGGRISLLVVLGAMLKFLTNLHNRHNQQAIMYRDRLVALSMVDLLMRHGHSYSRESIIDELTKTFISLDFNAFSVRQKDDARIQQPAKADRPSLLKIL